MSFSWSTVRSVKVLSFFCGGGEGLLGGGEGLLADTLLRGDASSTDGGLAAWLDGNTFWFLLFGAIFSQLNN